MKYSFVHVFLIQMEHLVSGIIIDMYKKCIYTLCKIVQALVDNF